MKNVHYEIILQSLTEDMLRQDAKIKNLQRRYDELKAVHAADTKAFWQDYHQKDRQIKELQDGIDKLINEKNELAKSFQNSLADKNEEDARQKVISECVDLVNQIYDFCKERNLKLSMDFVNDGKDPEIFIWDSIGDSSICRVVYSSDWITTLKTILSRLKGSYKMCDEAKVDLPVKPKANEDGNNGSVTPND